MTLKIGVIPKSEDFSHPSDRRRFMSYARARNIEIEIVKRGIKYDAIVLNQNADLSSWTRYPENGTKIIYDAADSYILINSSTLKERLRGTWKFVSGQSRRLQINYSDAVKRMCERADAVVCTTEEQREEISKYCKDVSIILDAQDEDLSAEKVVYESGDTFHFVWEGLASSGIPLAFLTEVLQPLSETRSIALHLVTDLSYHKYGGKLFRHVVEDDVRKIAKDFAKHVTVHEWTAENLSNMAVQADMALIPLDLNDTLQRGKPENKLLLFWRMGIPVITSPSPAYVRTMQKIGADMYCRTADEWREKIMQYMDDPKARELVAQDGRTLAAEEYNLSEMHRRWDQVFASL